jgi:hypothetical protein
VFLGEEAGMRISKSLRFGVILAVTLALLAPGSADAQVPATSMVARFAGSAVVNPSIGLFGVPEAVVQTPAGPWRWAFANDPGSCQVAGRSGGAAVAGECTLSGGGPLLVDLAQGEGKPRCGNSRGQGPGASFVDGVRSWSGEIHWDGVTAGDPSFSIGSWLILFGTMSSNAGTAQVIQFLNATGSPQCHPATNTNWPGESRFAVNGVMVVRSV